MSLILKFISLELRILGKLLPVLVILAALESARFKYPTKHHSKHPLSSLF